MNRKKRIAVLCSGGGTNFQALADACLRGEISGGITLMISSSKSAYAIERAKNLSIPYLVMPKQAYPSLEDAYAARHEALIAENPDLIVLAGYLGILLPETIKRFAGRVINTHPALIPAFCGKGMYGARVHEAVLASGVKLSGATIHFAAEGIDTGPIILQKSVPVLQTDGVSELAARILPVEHELLVKAVSLFCADKLQINGNRVLELS